MLLIGVTGGIGSGKSLVCSMFEKLGVPVFSADPLAKELMLSDPHLKRKLVSLMGPEVYTRAGELNRAFIASKIFSNERLKRTLDGLVHPRVEKKILSVVHLLAKEQIAYAIVEAALIFESGFEKKLDYVIVVDSPQTIRLDRVQKRDTVSRRQVLARMNAQWSVRKKRQMADVILPNTGTKQQLRSRVLFLHKLFISLSTEVAS